MKPRPDTIEILHRLRRGDRAAYDDLLPHLYDELRLLARRELRRERSGHTLQPTSLVHEAYLRLAGGAVAEADDRAHFVAVAARVMRRVLVDHARARRRRKRGGDQPARVRVSLSELPAAHDAEQADLIALDQALDRLGAAEPRKARVVELLYFGGLTAKEAGRLLHVTARTIERDWAYARAWLLREMSGCHPPTGSSSAR